MTTVRRLLSVVALTVRRRVDERDKRSRNERPKSYWLITDPWRRCARAASQPAARAQLSRLTG